MAPPTGPGEALRDQEDTPVVYDVPEGCSLADVDEDELYVGTVNGLVEYGVFVDLTESISGLVHTTNLRSDPAVGDRIVVRIEEIRENGDVSLEEVAVPEFDVRRLVRDEATTVADLEDRAGEDVVLVGDLVGVNQTGGPTVFQLRDPTGVVPCAAFEAAGVRAYPDLEVGAVVRVSGTVETREGAIQVEVRDMGLVDETAERDLRERLETAVAEAAEPPAVDPLVEWDPLEAMWEDLRAVARRLRQAVLEGRPIRLRHHADGDGLCASVPVELALERFVAEHYHDEDAPRHLLRRLPSKAPFYELEDVTRDLNFALGNRARHGQKLPLVCMLDNGSTEEDTPAYRNLAHYDIPILVVDHHHPDPDAIDPFVEHHVNPYLHGEDYRVTTGMLCVEIARLIDPSLTDDLQHVPAVAGLADHSEATAMADYLDIAASAGYDDAHLRDIWAALDYATHWLRYSSGTPLVHDVLDIDHAGDGRHEELVEFLSSRAQRDVEAQLEAATPHVDHQRLDNGAHLYRVDVENAAYRFTYPAPGKTTGQIHDEKVEETEAPVITIGYGPDFAVLRSDGVRLDIPEYVDQLASELPGGGVTGGGHLVVGSIKFVSGMREPVLGALVEKMENADIDEDLASSGQLDD